MKKLKDKIIKVNFNNLKSIKNAERKKSQLENKGYCQKSMKPTGYDKFVLVYRKDKC
jgi:hypothetical protein